MFKRILAGILSAVIIFSSLSPAVNAVEMTETVQEEVAVEEESSEEIVEIKTTEVEEDLETELEMQPEPEVKAEEVVEEILAVEEVAEVVAYEAGTEGDRTVVKEGKCGENITWTLYSDGELVISGSGAMDIDATYSDDYPWYQYSSEIIKVVCEEGITSIGNYAFNNYDKLEEIVLAESITYIGDEAFSSCDLLNSVEFPNSLTNIGASSFINCDALSSIDFSKNLTSIGAEAFENCDNLTSVILPKSLKSIGNNAFSSEYLESVQYTGTWKEWEALRFSSDPYCGIYDYEVTAVYDFSYKSNGNNTVMITGAAAGGIGGVVQIPETIGGYSVTAIAEKAFENNQTIQILDIPSSIIVIENQAFYNTAIRKLTLHEGLQRIEDSAFYNALGYWGSDTSYKMEELVLPEGLQTIGQSAFRESRMNGKIIVPSSVTSIGESAFDIDDEILYKGSAQQWIDIHNADTNKYPPRSKVEYEEDGPGFIKEREADQSISYRLFSWTSAEENIIVPSEFRGMPVTGIDSFAFQNNTNVISVTIPESVTSIEWATFSGCSNLEKVEIDAPISTLPSSMFYECINLKEVYLPHTITSINDNAFYQCNSLEKIHYDSEYNWDKVWKKVNSSSGNGTMQYAEVDFLHDWGYEFVEEWNGSQRYLASCRIVGKKEIGKKLNIPNDFRGIPVKYIGYDNDNIPQGLFQDNQDIKTVTIPENVEYIYKNTFKGCTNLAEITLPENLKEVRESAFEGCTSLVNIVFPENLKVIKQFAFEGCTSLVSITFPEELESLYEAAFKGCTSLENVSLPKVLYGVGESVFEDCTGLKTVTFSEDSYEGSKMFKGCTSLTQIVFPEKMEYSGSCMFEGCTGLKSIVIPQKVNLGPHAFKDCTGLENITFASNYTGIVGCHLFSGCKGIKEIIMPIDGFSSYYSLSECDDMDWEEKKSSVFEGVSRNAKVKVVKDSQGYRFMEELGFTNLTVSIVLREITLPKSISVEFGKSKTATITKVPAQANDTLNLVWTSSDESIATVDENGVITGKSLGSTQITVKDLNSGKSAKTTVQVILPGTSKITTKMTPAIDSLGLQSGQSVTMQIFAAGLSTEEPLDPALFTFTSSDDSIVTVNENGVIKSVYKGTKTISVKITAKLNNDPSGRKVYVSVKTIPVQVEELQYHVSEDVEFVDGIVIIPKLKVAEGDYSFGIYAQPLNSAEELIPASLKWTSSNSKVATVASDGMVTVKKNADGIATITATVNDLKKAKAAIDIDVRDYSPRLAANTVTLNTNTYEEAQVQIYPVYETEVKSVRLEGNEYLYADYKEYNGNHTITIGAKDVVKKGTYKLNLIAEIEGKGEYVQSFTVKVANSIPAITVKQTSVFNLFYLDSNATVNVTAKNAVVADAYIDDTDTFKSSEFDTDNSALTLTYDNPDSILDKKATLYIELEGYREPIQKAFNINAKEVKPVLSQSRTSTKLSSLSSEGVPIEITDKSAKQVINWANDSIDVSVYESSVDYVDVNCDETQLTISPILHELKFVNGKTSHAAKLEIQGENWLKPIVISHTISINTKLPTIKAKSTTLTLNRLFGNEVQTEIIPSLSNCPVPVDYEIEALNESVKDLLTVDAEGWNLTAKFADIDNLPVKGSYKYNVIANIEEEEIKTTVTIKVTESTPKVTLGKTTVSLNKTVEDYIEFAASVVSGYEIVDMDVSPATGNDLIEDQLSVEFNADTKMVTATVFDKTIVNKTYKYLLTPLVKAEGADSEIKPVVLKPITLSVKVHGNKVSVTTSVKGSIDLVTRDNGIVYTITGGKNFNYHLEDILAEDIKIYGESANLFDIDVLEPNEKGQPQLMIKAKADAELSTVVTYKYKLLVKVNGFENEIETAEFKVKPKQTKLSLQANGNLNIYQSVKNGEIRIELIKPADAKIQDLQILSTKATTVPEGALDYQVIESGDGTYVVRYTVKQPDKLKVNAGYKLSLSVTPEGNASNQNPQTFTITLKAKR